MTNHESASAHSADDREVFLRQARENLKKDLLNDQEIENELAQYYPEAIRKIIELGGQLNEVEKARMRRIALHVAHLITAQNDIERLEQNFRTSDDDDDEDPRL